LASEATVAKVRFEMAEERRVRTDNIIFGKKKKKERERYEREEKEEDFKIN
jgi:hypothetical protein